MRLRVWGLFFFCAVVARAFIVTVPALAECTAASPSGPRSLAAAAAPWDTSLGLEAGSAIRRGCGALAARQSKSGDWQRDVRRTALSVMALAGAPGAGTPALRASVTRGLQWLAARQSEAGSIGGDAISTAFTLLAFSNGPDARITRLQATKACRFLLKCRCGAGGFALRPGGAPEAFVTACSSLALMRFLSVWYVGATENARTAGPKEGAGNMLSRIRVFQNALASVENMARGVDAPSADRKTVESAAVFFLLRYIMQPTSVFPVDDWGTFWTRLRRDCPWIAGKTGPVRTSSAFLLCALTGVAADVRGAPPEKRRTVRSELENFVRGLLESQRGDGSWNTLDATVWALLALEACGIGGR